MIKELQHVLIIAKKADQNDFMFPRIYCIQQSISEYLNDFVQIVNM